MEVCFEGEENSWEKGGRVEGEEEIVSQGAGRGSVVNRGEEDGHQPQQKGQH